MKTFLLDENITVCVSDRGDGSVGLYPNDEKKKSDLPDNLMECVGLGVEEIMEVNQVHSNAIVLVDSSWEQKSKIKIASADGMLTNVVNLGLLVKTADCIPMVMWSGSKFVGILHIGWRGAVSGIVNEAIKLIKESFGDEPQVISAWLGPAIYKNDYCFWDKPRQANDSKWKKFVEKNGEMWCVDLKGFVKSELVVLGLKKNNIIDSGINTAESEWFSHKKGDVGRFATVAKIVKK